MVTIIAAVNKNRGIGYKGDLLYRLPDDLKRFKKFTTGATVIMGRKTFESLPNGALSNRRNIVLTHSDDVFPGAQTIHSLKEAIESLDGEVFIIGGASVFEEALSIADKLCLTEVQDDTAEADTFFPDYSDWIRIWSEYHPADERHKYAFEFADYLRSEKKSDG
ncbi:MAG: dihydrofolate reductase [Bacteroidales bacterium]|nr:dihydrofolate reductase [Bacteroidales bacterium]